MMKYLTILLFFYFGIQPATGINGKKIPIENRDYKELKKDLNYMYKYEAPPNQNMLFVKKNLNSSGETVQKTIYSITGKKLFRYTYKYTKGKLTQKKVRCSYRLYKGDFYYTNGTIVYMTFDLKSGTKHIMGERQFENGVCTKVNVKKEKLWYNTQWNASSGKSTSTTPISLAAEPSQIEADNRNYCRQYSSLFREKYTTVQYSYDYQKRIDAIIYMDGYSRVGKLLFDYNCDGSLDRVRQMSY